MKTTVERLEQLLALNTRMFNAALRRSLRKQEAGWYERGGYVSQDLTQPRDCDTDEQIRWARDYIEERYGKR